jgi:hypothetical protein
MRIPESCPRCDAVAWYRDGVTVQLADGDLVARRVMPSAHASDDWSCAECGQEIGSRVPLARRLDEVAATADDAIGRSGFVA